MSKYTIWIEGTYSKRVGEIEANSEDEAIEKACNELDGYVSLCHHCASIDLSDGDFTAEEITQ